MSEIIAENPTPDDTEVSGTIDITLKVNASTIDLDNQTVDKLVEIIDMLRENQVILMDKIDHIEISLTDLHKEKEE